MCKNKALGEVGMGVCLGKGNSGSLGQRGITLKQVLGSDLVPCIQRSSFLMAEKAIKGLNFSRYEDLVRDRSVSHF